MSKVNVKEVQYKVIEQLVDLGYDANKVHENITPSFVTGYLNEKVALIKKAKAMFKSPAFLKAYKSLAATVKSQVAKLEKANATAKKALEAANKKIAALKALKKPHAGTAKTAAALKKDIAENTKKIAKAKEPLNAMRKKYAMVGAGVTAVGAAGYAAGKAGKK